MRLRKYSIMTVVCVFAFTFPVFAQSDTPSVADLERDIARSQGFEEAAEKLHELVDVYMHNNQFDALYEYLHVLQKKNMFKKSPLIPYYKALTRLNQVQFMEENKQWEELFDRKDTYYADMDQALEAIGTMSDENYDIALKAKLLEYKLTKSKDEDLFEALQALLHLAQEAVEKQHYNPVALKDIANELLYEGEANYAKKLYSLYVSKITQIDVQPEELKKMANDFLEEENVDLAVSLFTAYVDKLVDTHQGKDFIMKETIKIADAFINTGWHKGKDPFFAEDLFLKIEEVYTSDAFEDLTQYKRAYNLEKMKEYEASVKEYEKLVNEFGDYQYKDRIYFRLGILSAYALGERDQARTFFLKVINDFKKSLDYLNSVYHLGLLHHWEGDLENAMTYYNRIIEKAKGADEELEVVRLASERRDEIRNNQEIEYNIRSFLNVILTPKTNTPFLQLDLFAKNAKEYLDKPVTFQVNTYLMGTSCLQQNYTYLWSGQLGTNRHPFNKETLETSYHGAGTKVVNVALVDQTGVVSGAFEMADIYDE